MRLFIYIILSLFPGFIVAQKTPQIKFGQIEVNEVGNTVFKNDKFWRGADGAASIDLRNGEILWLFSDTFIDPDGTGKRSNSKMIRNSIAIQDGKDLDHSIISYYRKGSKRKPKSFFELSRNTWFWLTLKQKPPSEW